MSIHHRLAEAEIKLRNAKDDHDRAKAYAEEHASVDGKNAEERARRLTIVLSHNDQYQSVLRTLRGAEAAVSLLRADLATEEDARRQREWDIRLQLVQALSFAGVQTDSKAPIERAFDDVADADSLGRLEENLRNGYQEPAKLSSFEAYAQGNGYQKDGSSWVKDPIADLPL